LGNLDFRFPVEGAHPCVVFSNSARLANPAFDRINVLLCRTLRNPLQRELRAAEVLLDSADGLDWETLCRVDSLHFVLKATLRERRGLVCVERRRIISQRMLQLFPFNF